MEPLGCDCQGCGRKHDVTAPQAGTTLVCACGFEIQIPPLSELRRQAGMRAYEKSVVQEIAEGIQDGKLPSNDDCLGCHRPKTRKRWLEAVCERGGARTRTTGGDVGGFVAGLIGGIPFVIPLGDGSSGELIEDSPGRDVTVFLPAPICDECRRHLHRGVGTFVCRVLLRGFLTGALVFLLVWLVAPNIGWPTPSFYWIWLPLGCALATWFAGLYFGRQDEAALKSALSTAEPAYERLFAKYPDALLSIQDVDPGHGR